MSKRMEALWRIAAFLWSLVAGFVAGIVLFVGMFVGAIDVAWQLLLGSDGLSESSWTMDFLRRVAMWPVNLTVFAITGSGEMQWLP